MLGGQAGDNLAGLRMKTLKITSQLAKIKPENPSPLPAEFPSDLGRVSGLSLQKEQILIAQQAGHRLITSQRKPFFALLLQIRTFAAQIEHYPSPKIHAAEKNCSAIIPNYLWQCKNIIVRFASFFTFFEGAPNYR